MYKCDFLRHHHIKGPKIQQRVDMRTHFNPTEAFQYTFFTTCHPPEAKKGFVKGEALGLLRTNSLRKRFEENVITSKKKHLMERRLSAKRSVTTHSVSEVKFQERTHALLQ